MSISMSCRSMRLLSSAIRLWFLDKFTDAHGAPDGPADLVRCCKDGCTPCTNAPDDAVVPLCNALEGLSHASDVPFALDDAALSSK